MKELGRIIAYAAISAIANVVALWASYKLKEETSKKREKTDES
jgi:hypothetical protein